jgi:hypothetical protein
MRPLFSFRPDCAGTKIVKGLSPEEWRLFSFPECRQPQRRSRTLAGTSIDAIDHAKINEGIEPGEMLPLALGTNEEKQK